MNVYKKNVFVAIIIVVLTLLVTVFLFFVSSMPKDWTSSSSNNKDSYSFEEENENIEPQEGDAISTSTGAKVHIVNSYNEKMFKGKKSLVFFWASWCSHCLEELDVIKESMKTYSNRDFNIYVISHDYKLQELTSFMEKENIQFDMYFDENRIIRKNIDPPASSVPLLYVINEDISIAKKADGAVTFDKVKQFVDYIETAK